MTADTGTPSLLPLNLPCNDQVWNLIDEIGEPLAADYWKETSGPYGNHSQITFERAISRLLSINNVLTAFETIDRAEERVSTQVLLEVLNRMKEVLGGKAPASPDGMLEYRLETILDRLEGRPGVDGNVLLVLEVSFGPYISNPKRVRRQISSHLGNHPKVFVELMQALYRREGEEPPTEESEGSTRALKAENAYNVVSSWNGYPGEGLTPAEREQKLELWAAEVLDACYADGRGAPASSPVGEVLARAPDADDGIWPCIAARRLLRRNKYPHLSDGLRIAKHNRRGVTTRATLEGGTQELELAKKYRDAASHVQETFPETAVMLGELARDYEREAESWEVRAKRRRIENGDDDDPVLADQPQPQPSTALREGLNHIRHIHVENLRCFDTLTIKDIPVDEEHGQCLMLLGANGTGKTTLLRAIAAALLDQQAAGTGIDAMTAPLLLLRNSSLPGKIEITLGEDVFGVQFVPEAGRLKVRPLGKPPTARPWVVGYGCFRGSLLGGNAHAMAPAGDTATLWGEGMGLWPSIQALDELQQRAKEGDSHSKNLMAGATHALTEVLHDIDEVTVESERLAIGGKGVGGKHSALALSDGYLGTMGWVLDMIFRWSSRQQALGKPIKVNFLAEMEGVAIVDDIDLHMHPSWQRKLLKRLQSTFPRMTFVGTTHNPQTILGVRKPEKIQVLRRSFEDPAQIEARAMEVPVGRRADQVLTGGWFGLDSTLDDETLALMDEHQRLLLQPVRDEAELTRLQEEIGSRIYRFIDTSREAYVYGIVTEILREQLPKLQPEEREKARQQLKEMVKARLAARDGKTA
jgi:hypothetical protein